MSARNTIKSIQKIMRPDTGVDGDAQRLSQLCWMFFLKIIDDQDQQLEMMQDNYQSPIPEKFQWRTWAANPEGITGDALLNFINGELFPSLKELPTNGKQASRARVVKSVFEDAYNYMKSGQIMRQVINKISGVDFNDLAERKHFGDIYEQLLNDLQSAGNAGEYYTPRAVTAFMVDRIDPKPGEILFDPSCGTGGFLTCAIRHMRDRYIKKVEDEQSMQTSLRAVEKKQLPHMLCVTNMLLHGIEDPSFVRHDNTLGAPLHKLRPERPCRHHTHQPALRRGRGRRHRIQLPGSFPTQETADLFLALFIRLLKPGGRAAIVLPDGSLFGEGVKTRLKEHLLEECNLHTIVRLPNSVFKPYASIGTNLLFFEKGEPTKEIWFYEHRVTDGQKAYSMTKPIRVTHLQDCVDWWGGAERQNRQETEVTWKVGIDEIKARNYNLDFKNPHTVADEHGDPSEMLIKLGRDEQNTASLRNQLKAILAKALPQMNAGHLLQHFERLSEVPNAIPRLRRFILDLAVRGKLVEQDPNDEPAMKLLKRIQVEKTRLVKEGRLKKEKPLAPVEEEETPFSVPASWTWARLQDITSYIQRGKSPIYATDDGFPVVSQKCVQWRGFDLSAAKLITKESIKKYEEARFLRENDLLWNSTGTGTIGRVVRVVSPPENLVCDSHVTVVRCVLTNAEYVRSWLRSDHIYQLIEDRAAGSTNQVELTAQMATSQVVPIPPLAEQHRIVVKVDELMALCDQLEAQRVTIEAESSRLLEAVLHEALAPALEEAAR